jgi:hypothetical protein
MKRGDLAAWPSCPVRTDASESRLPSDGTRRARFVGDCSIEDTASIARRACGNGSFLVEPLRFWRELANGWKRRNLCRPLSPVRVTAFLKGFGCRREHEHLIRYQAGVRKPRKKEPAGRRWAVGRLWGFVARAALPADGLPRLGKAVNISLPKGCKVEQDRGADRLQPRL